MSTKRNGAWGWILVMAGLGLVALTVVTWADVLVTGQLPEAPNTQSNVAGVMCAPPIVAICLIMFGFGLVAQAWRDARTVRDGVPSWGVVTAVEGTGMSIDDVPQVRVRVRVDGADAVPFEAECLAMYTSGFQARVSVGTKVALIIDPTAPEHAFIDLNVVESSQ